MPSSSRGGQRVRLLHRVSRRSKRFKLRLPSFFGPLVVLLLAFSLGYLAFNFYMAWENRLGKGGTRITVVVASENPTVYSYNSQNESLSVVTIPKNTEVRASGGYGNWFVGSLWGLGVQEKKKGKILQNSIQKSFGIPVDVWVGPGGEDLFEDGKLGVLGILGKILKLSSLETSLTFFDKVNLLFSVGGVSRFSRNEISIFKEGVLVEHTFSDGVQGYIVIPERTIAGLDSLRDDRVFAEAKTLRINNASGVLGLAVEVSRVVSILGLRVIATENAKEKLVGEICVVSGQKDGLKSVAARRLAQIYKCRLSETDVGGPFSLEMSLGDRFAGEF